MNSNLIIPENGLQIGVRYRLEHVISDKNPSNTDKLDDKTDNIKLVKHVYIGTFLEFDHNNNGGIFENVDEEQTYENSSEPKYFKCELLNISLTNEFISKIDIIE